MTQLSDAFEDLSHALRVLPEALLRAGEGLLRIDRAEAVGNIELALTGVLNAFHSLYDATQKDSRLEIDWYAAPELATILTLRNARHHNHAKKVRTIYAHYVQEAQTIGVAESYVFLDFPPAETGSDTFDLYLSWMDLKALLGLPFSTSRIRESVASSIRDYLGVGSFPAYASQCHQPEERVFFNVIPLICNAAAKLAPLIAPNVEPRSTESEVYLLHFADLPQSDTLSPEVICVQVKLT